MDMTRSLTNSYLGAAMFAALAGSAGCAAPTTAVHAPADLQRNSLFVAGSYVAKADIDEREDGSEEVDGQPRVRSGFTSVREQFEMGKPQDRFVRTMPEEGWTLLKRLAEIIAQPASGDSGSGLRLAEEAGGPPMPHGLETLGEWGPFLIRPALAAAPTSIRREPLQPGDLCENAASTEEEEEGCGGCEPTVQRLVSSLRVESRSEGTSQQPEVVYFRRRADSARHICASTERHFLLTYACDGRLQHIAEIDFDFDWFASESEHPEYLQPCGNKYACCSSFGFREPDDAPRSFTRYAVWSLHWTKEGKIAEVVRREATYNQVLVHETDRDNVFSVSRFLPAGS